MLRRGSRKYIRCPGDPDQLYDLARDPAERENLAEAPASAAAVRAFRAESDASWDLAGLERRVLASQARRHRVAAALAEGAHSPWDFQPHVDASRQYVRGAGAGRHRPGERPPPGGLPE
jgi:choline-sulfatase